MFVITRNVSSKLKQELGNSNLIFSRLNIDDTLSLGQTQFNFNCYFTTFKVYLKLSFCYRYVYLAYDYKTNDLIRDLHSKTIKFSKCTFQLILKIFLFLLWAKSFNVLYLEKPINVRGFLQRPFCGRSVNFSSEVKRNGL